MRIGTLSLPIVVSAFTLSACERSPANLGAVRESTPRVSMAAHGKEFWLLCNGSQRWKNPPSKEVATTISLDKSFQHYLVLVPAMGEAGLFSSNPGPTPGGSKPGHRAIWHIRHGVSGDVELGALAYGRVFEGPEEIVFAAATLAKSVELLRLNKTTLEAKTSDNLIENVYKCQPTRQGVIRYRQLFEARQAWLEF